MRKRDRIRHGRALRKMRIEAGWDQNDLTRHTGITQQYISELELGKKVPALKTQYKLVQALGPKAGRLWGYDKQIATPGGKLWLRVEEAGLTVDAVANYCGVSTTAIYDYEHNEYLPSIVVAAKIDELLSKGQPSIWAGVALPTRARHMGNSVKAGSPGAKLRQFREWAHLSQAALAEQSDTAQETISAAEGNKHTPQLDRQRRIAAVLGVRVDDIWGVDPEWGMPPDKETKGHKLKVRRIELGYSWQELANKTGVSIEAIKRFEDKGPQRVTPTVMAVTRGLGMDLEELFPIHNADRFIGPRLQRLRYRVRLTPQQVATALGITRQAWLIMEQSHATAVSARHTPALVRLFGVDEDELSID